MANIKSAIKRIDVTKKETLKNKYQLISYLLIITHKIIKKKQKKKLHTEQI